MTKSTITREQLEEWVAQFDEDGGCDATDRQLEALIRQSLAAMDSEPAAPVAEVVSIYGDPEAFGEREIRPLVGIQQMPYGTKLYRHAQPAPVVQCPFPCGWDNLNKLAIHDAALVARGLVEGELTTEAHRQAAISNNDRLLKVISACRAAILAAAKHDTTALNSVQSVDSVADRWIPVSERIPDNTEPVLCIEKRADFGTYGQPFVCWHDGGGWVGKTNYRPIVTHWMPLPAAPQEVGDA